MKYFTLLLTFLLGTYAMAQTTIGEFISSAATTNHLESIVLNFGLEGLLQDSTNLTVFAPSDAAIEDYAASIGIEITEFLGSQEALKMIQYHVIQDQQILFANITNEIEVYTALGTTMTCSASNSTSEANEVSIATPDFELDNGVIHLVNAVVTPSMSVYDWIDGSSSHNYIKIAIDNSGLTEMFQALTTMTFFAPNDAAFINFTAENDIDIYDVLYDPNVSSVVMNHILDESLLFASDLLAGGANATGTGESIVVFLDASGAAVANGAPILSADEMTHNGLIHSVGGIIQPMTLLSDVLQAQGLTLIDTLLSFVGVNPAINFDPFEYTLFAPTDSAILSFLEEGETTLEDVLNDPEGLSEGLLYHLTSGITLSSQLTDGMEISMESSPDDIATVTFIGDSIFINESMVIAADFSTFNGVVHVIDKVLEQPESGCMDQMACNFNEDAVLEDGSCYSIDALITTENNACLNGTTGSISVDSVLYNVTDDLEFGLFDSDGNELAENETGLFGELSAGMYFVDISDGEECGQTFMLVITEPDGEALEFEASSTQNEDGTIEGSTTISGGLAPYSVGWYEAATLELVDAMNLTNGTYIVAVTDANGCKVSEEITIDYTSSIDAAEANSFRIYPNPTNGLFQLETSQNGSLQLSVFNANGSIVLEWNGMSADVSSFDLGEFPSGFYTIQLIHQNVVSQQLILKND